MLLVKVAKLHTNYELEQGSDTTCHVLFEAMCWLWECANISPSSQSEKQQQAQKQMHKGKCKAIHIDGFLGNCKRVFY